MKIRTMKVDDFGPMYSLWKRAGMNLSSRAVEKIETVRMLKLNRDSCFVAVEEERIIGTIFGTFNGRRGWMYHLAIHPRFQKKGIGSSLLKEAEKALKRTGTRTIGMFVDVPNDKVVGFYKKHGYERASDVIYMRKKLG